MRVALKLGIAVFVAPALMACGTATPSASAPQSVPAPRVATDEVHTDTPQQTAKALSDDHCRSDTLCALSGFCTSHGDECVASADEDCLQSQQCLTDGACTARDEICVAVSNDEACRARSSRRCLQLPKGQVSLCAGCMAKAVARRGTTIRSPIRSLWANQKIKL